jgi:arylsulfatase A-like enzyme
LPAGKQTAFEEDIRVPMVIRGPGIPAARTSGALVGNVDLAPTFAALAGARTPRFVDGRSLVDELRGGPSKGPHRRAFLLEHWREHGQLLRDPQLPLEPPDNDETETPQIPGSPHPGIVDKDRIPNYEGIRTDHYTYVEYINGERELYDLTADPAELHNAYARATSRTKTALHRELLAVETCAGVRCRRGESQPTVVLRFRPKTPR